MKSMTGFGKSRQQNKDVSIEISIKSVNGRYLDVKVHGPRVYVEFENEIKKTVANKIQRGTVELYINRRSKGTNEVVVFNQKLVDQWTKGFTQLATRIGVSTEIGPEVLMQIPDFYRIEEGADTVKKEKSILLKCVSSALESCLREREREGRGLKSDLNKHLSSLKQSAGQLKTIRAKSLKSDKEKYLQKFKKLQANEDLDESRMLQEVVYLIEKSDISEELQRLDAHIKAIKKLLGQSGTVLAKSWIFMLRNFCEK